MSNNVDIRQLRSDEIPQLEPCLLELAAYHNSLSIPFAGVFPYLPISAVLEAMAANVQKGKGVANAVFEDSRIIGFCNLGIEGTYGQVENLFVFAEKRGCGYGRSLMDRALDIFRARGVTLVDIQVVHGNPTESFYAKYGFCVRSLVMARRLQP